MEPRDLHTWKSYEGEGEEEEESIMQIIRAWYGREERDALLSRDDILAIACR